MLGSKTVVASDPKADERNAAKELENTAYKLLELTAVKMLQRIKAADGDNPLSAAEYAQIIAFLKANNVTVSGAQARTGPVKRLADSLPQFPTDDDD